MKTVELLLVGLITGIALTFGSLAFAAYQNSLAFAPASTSLGARPAIAGAANDSDATPIPPSGPFGDEVPPANAALDAASIDALPTPIPGETLAYFVPSDNDATATVLYLYNTDTVTHTVALRGFNYDGALAYAQNITIGGSSFLRMVSDSVAAAPPPSWATPAPVTTNFTDFTYFASLSLPKGVKAEGYVLFNPGTGTVDPRKDQGAIPLRFSTDPASLFLPAVQSSN